MNYTDNKMKEKHIETDVNSMAIMIFQEANLLGFLWKDKPYGVLPGTRVYESLGGNAGPWEDSGSQ